MLRVIGFTTCALMDTALSADRLTECFCPIKISNVYDLSMKRDNQMHVTYPAPDTYTDQARI